MSATISLLSWGNVIGTLVAYYTALAFYRLFLHPLARFPGPRLAAISRWYEGYYDVVRGGQYTIKIAELHKKYGPIVRISPHELHVIDPAFFETLYRMDGRWDKYGWTYDAFGAPRSTVFTTDHDAHKARRHAVAPLFSKAKIAARQQVLNRHVDKLCKRISGLAGTSFNLGAAISAFARNISNEFVTGKEYNDLDSDDFNVALSIASQGAGSFWRTTKFIRWFGPALRAMPVDWAAKVADDGTRSFLRYLQQCEQDTRDSLAAVTSQTPESTETKFQDTLVHTIVHSDLPPEEKTFLRIRQEVGTVTGAGFETTANALRLILYHVYTSPTILHRLRQELSNIPPSTTPALKTLEQLPYLTAVLTEGMRLSPAIGTRAARITDKDLFYRDWRIPAGTPVGMTTLLMHVDPELFPDPMRFDPERWLGARGVSNKKWFAPFGRGTRICLGMHLAWAEMYLVLAALVQRFDFSIEGATAADFEFERDNFGIGTKAGCNLLARASLYEA